MLRREAATSLERLVRPYVRPSDITADSPPIAPPGAFERQFCLLYKIMYVPFYYSQVATLLLIFKIYICIVGPHHQVKSSVHIMMYNNDLKVCMYLVIILLYGSKLFTLLFWFIILFIIYLFFYLLLWFKRK